VELAPSDKGEGVKGGARSVVKSQSGLGDFLHHIYITRDKIPDL